MHFCGLARFEPSRKPVIGRMNMPLTNPQKWCDVNIKHSVRELFLTSCWELREAWAEVFLIKCSMRVCYLGLTVSTSRPRGAVLDRFNHTSRTHVILIYKYEIRISHSDEKHNAVTAMVTKLKWSDIYNIIPQRCVLFEKLVFNLLPLKLYLM